MVLQERTPQVRADAFNKNSVSIVKKKSHERDFRRKNYEFLHGWFEKQTNGAAF